MTLIMSFQDLQQENGILMMIKIIEYGEGSENDSTIKFETKVIKPSPYDYSVA